MKSTSPLSCPVAAVMARLQAFELYLRLSAFICGEDLLCFTYR